MATAQRKAVHAPKFEVENLLEKQDKEWVLNPWTNHSRLKILLLKADEEGVGDTNF